MAKPTPRPTSWILRGLALLATAAPPLAAQDSTAVAAPDSIAIAAQGTAVPGPRVPDARRGSQVLIPLGSVIFPGLGQYLHDAPLIGLAYTATAGAAAAVFLTTVTDPSADSDGLPRGAANQLAFEALHVQQTAGFLSAWDAFHRAVPALRQEGKYAFLTSRESLGDLLTAPFDTEFLRRETTWLHLAYTGLVAALVMAREGPDEAYEPFRVHDAAFVTALSLNAGIGEEALFRGWMLPMLHQNTGRRFWMSNAIQAGTFGALHLAQAREFAAVIAGWALYEGWLTRRNEWSIRESIFHHFWYDLFIGTAEMLADSRRGIQLTFPTIRF